MIPAGDHRILVVDANSHARQVAASYLTQIGCQVVEADTRQRVLSLALETSPKLLLLEVALPDGETRQLLADMRKLPELVHMKVIVVTTDVRPEIVAPLMELGVSDYILKPFPGPEFLTKVNKVLGLWKGPISEKLAAIDLPWSAEALEALDPAPEAEGGAAPRSPSAAAPTRVTNYVTMPTAAAEPSPGAEDGPAATPAGGGVNDVLLIDDMPNVARRFRELIPSTVRVDAGATAEEALELARLKTYRLVLIDMQMPNVDSGMLLRQLSLFQTSASFIALGLRTSASLLEDARTLGFDGSLNKPFESAKVADLVDRYFETKDKITIEGNMITIATPPQGADRLTAFYYRICGEVPKSLEHIAEACYSEVIINAPDMRGTRKNIIEVLVKLRDATAVLGLELFLVVPPEVVGYSKEIVETRGLRMFGTIDEAQAAIQSLQLGPA